MAPKTTKAGSPPRRSRSRSTLRRAVEISHKACEEELAADMMAREEGLRWEQRETELRALKIQREDLRAIEAYRVYSECQEQACRLFNLLSPEWQKAILANYAI